MSHVQTGKTMACLLSLRAERFDTKGRFTISRGTRTAVDVLTVTLQSEGCTGWGECVPYARYGETIDSVSEQIRSMETCLRQGLDRQSLQTLLPPGAARNGLDCALWDLEAKCSGVPVWQLAGLVEPESVTTAFTLSLDTPVQMQAAASRNAWRPWLKVKLGGEGDLQRLQAVHQGAPDSRLIVDANEGWSAAEYDALQPRLLDLGVVLLEQPLAVDADQALSGCRRSLPVCADESCHDRDSLPSLAGKYDVINIKLDKTGGLTEALALREAARSAGFDIMVGCMVGTSLGMAPAHLLAQGASYVDLDGPLLLASDRDIRVNYSRSEMHVVSSMLWG